MRLVVAVLASLRPRQWAKNLFVFAGVIFSQQLFTPEAWSAVAAFAALLRAVRRHLPPQRRGGCGEGPAASHQAPAPGGLGRAAPRAGAGHRPRPPRGERAGVVPPGRPLRPGRRWATPRCSRCTRCGSSTSSSSTCSRWRWASCCGRWRARWRWARTSRGGCSSVPCSSRSSSPWASAGTSTSRSRAPPPPIGPSWPSTARASSTR